MCSGSALRADLRTYLAGGPKVRIPRGAAYSHAIAKLSPRKIACRSRNIDGFSTRTAYARPAAAAVCQRTVHSWSPRSGALAWIRVFPGDDTDRNRAPHRSRREQGRTAR